MNLILLTPQDFVDQSVRARLTGRRHKHILEILKSKAGDSLQVGLLNQQLGTATVVEVNASSVSLQVQWTDAPPAPLAVTLILALPRPQVIKRVFQCISGLGIKRLILLNFNRVEKSLWQSSSLKPEAITEQLILGLEQAKDTVLPQVFLKRSFKEFVQKELPKLMAGTHAIMAHPGTGQQLSLANGRPVTLVVGPEGGLIDYEIAQLSALGFQPVDLGPRIYKVETVIPLLIGKLF